MEEDPIAGNNGLAVKAVPGVLTSVCGSPLGEHVPVSAMEDLQGEQGDIISTTPLLQDDEAFDESAGNASSSLHSCLPGVQCNAHDSSHVLNANLHGIDNTMHQVHGLVNVVSSPLRAGNDSVTRHLLGIFDDAVKIGMDGSSIGRPGVCLNSNMDSLPNPAGNCAWKKHGVIALPSLKDLGGSKAQNGVAQLDTTEVNTYVNKFQAALVGRLFGRHLPFSLLNGELKRRWDCFGGFKLLTLSSDCFICFFESTSARDSILTAGPWIVAGQVLGLDVWSPGFSPQAMHGFITPIWVRLPGLPLYCWGKNSLASISSLLGDPLWIDTATADMSRGAFARVCIRMDLSKPLPAAVQVLGLEGLFQQRVEYEGISNLCFTCGCVGHKAPSCPKVVPSYEREVRIPARQPNVKHSSVQVDGTSSITGRTIGKQPLRKDASSSTAQVTTNSSMAGITAGNAGANLHLHSADPPPTAQVHIKHCNGSSVLESPLQPRCDDEPNGYGPWMLVQRRRKPPPQPSKPHRKSLQHSPEVAGQNVQPDVVFGMNQVSNSSIPCQNGISHAQQPAVMLKPSSLHSPNGILQAQQPAVVMQPHTVDQQMVGEGPVGVFSFNTPKDLDLAGSLSLARVNSGRTTQIKARGSKGKSKQAVYEVGSLLEESHKKRKPSSQTIGEDASSLVPE